MNKKNLSNLLFHLQGALYGELLKLRSELASRNDYAPYMIASNKQMVDIAKYR